MGLISNDLKNIAAKLGSAKQIINNKYDSMRANNMAAPNALERLPINDLPPSIDRIEVGTSQSGSATSSKCTIVYVLNGAGRTAMVQEITHGEAFNITHIEPSRNDDAFLGWSDTADATSAQYTAGQYVDDNLVDKGNVYVLYAVWGESTPSSPPQKENTAPSVPELTMIPTVELNTVKSGRNVSFIAQSTDADDDSITYEWMIDDAEASPLAQPYDVGMHTVKCRAKDSEGLYSDWSDELTFNVKNSSSAPPVILKLEDPADPPSIASGYWEGSAFNVYGEVVGSDEKIDTTFYGTGFATRFQVYDSPDGMPDFVNVFSTISLDNPEMSRNGVTIVRNTSYSEDTNQVTTVYTLTNNDNANKYVWLCSHADVQIGYSKNNDVWVDTGTLLKNDTGFTLRHPDKDYQFYVYAQNLPGIVNAHTRWVGTMNGYKNHIWEESAESIVNEGDSALAFSWQNVEILPGETKTFAFILGIE